MLFTIVVKTGIFCPELPRMIQSLSQHPCDLDYIWCLSGWAQDNRTQLRLIFLELQYVHIFRIRIRHILRATLYPYSVMLCQICATAGINDDKSAMDYLYVFCKLTYACVCLHLHEQLISPLSCHHWLLCCCWVW